MFEKVVDICTQLGVNLHLPVSDGQYDREGWLRLMRENELHTLHATLQGFDVGGNYPDVRTSPSGAVVAAITMVRHERIAEENERFAWFPPARVRVDF